MAGSKTIVTLVSSGQAKIGSSFIYRGAGAKCKECKYFNVCIRNLEEDRIYKIVNLRDKILKCEFYDVEMRAVEVVEAEVPAAITSRQSIKGAIIRFCSRECNYQDCENIMLCFPEGLRDDDRCEVIEVFGQIKCIMGLQLMKALLRRVTPSS